MVSFTRKGKAGVVVLSWEEEDRGGGSWVTGLPRRAGWAGESLEEPSGQMGPPRGVG